MAEDVYRRLQQHFDGFYLRFPPTESGVEIRLLKKLFTPEEAEIASVIKCGHGASIKDFESIELIFEKVKHLGYSIKEVEKHLDKMAKNGAIMGTKRDGLNVYANAVLVVGIYEFQVNKLTKDFLDDFYQYLSEAWGPANSKIQTEQMRTIPVGVTIKRENPIAKYDDIRIFFENAKGPFSIINCVCRQSKDLYDKPCQMTDRREVCMGVGDFAQVYNDSGWGREIKKEEALEYLKQNEQEGLIFQTSNSQDFNFVCSCCHCCCGGITNLKRIPNPADYTSSNYLAVIDEDLCTGCENCIDRCQMNAITLENEISVINQVRCIGCGNCILDCPSDAISLLSKEELKVPPITFDETYKRIADERKNNIN
ncbi:MAG: 4Fe-4S dicluster domain-containing protein [Asgard group archaeon]|nr:4Fe-4S dicluster domain-containing protein [Asgard group archaeon]